MPFTDRLDYLAAMNMNLGWSLCVEKLLGITVSEKTRHLRVIIAELGRIANHLVAASSSGLDLGSFTPFTWTFREREKIVNLFEDVCGARLTYSYIAPGGVTGDLPAGWLKKCEQFLDEFTPVIDELHAMLTNNSIFIHRMGGVGVHSGGDGDRLSAAPARCCAAAASIGTCAVTANRSTPRCTMATPGGSWRPSMAAIRPTTSIRRCRARRWSAIPGTGTSSAWWNACSRWTSIRQGMEKYAKAAGAVDGPIEVKKKLPKGEAYLETEAPKGQMGFMIVSDGTPIPWRVRIRSSSFCNLSVLSEICRGLLIADLPAVLASLDIVLGEIDR